MSPFFLGGGARKHNVIEKWSMLVYGGGMRLNANKRAHSVINDDLRAFITHFHFLRDGPFFCIEKLLLYLRAPTIFVKRARYDEK